MNPSQYNYYHDQQTHHDPSKFQTPVTGANAITPQNNSFFGPATHQTNTNSRGGYRGLAPQRSSKRTRCPKLLPVEYDLLEKHSGCRKCRKFYVNHKAPDCPNGWPNPDTYVTLTEDMANKAMASAAIASTYNSSMLTSSSFSTLSSQYTGSEQHLKHATQSINHHGNPT